MENCRNEHIWTMLGLVIKVVKESSKFAGEKRKGGYFCLFDIDLGRPILVSMVGEVLAEKAGKYHELSIEKSQRLFEHQEHKSSFESKNEAEQKYGGAIRGRRYIFSFSGFKKEEEDEAIMLAVAELLKEIDPYEAELIAIRSMNSFYPRLLEQFKNLNLLHH
ncbi:MAG: hypothetical protein QMD65_00070 [Patescibacteria group bacterium]|nr:hypothetical protein [Patescibacteria group bacterium]